MNGAVSGDGAESGWFDNEHPGLRRFWHPIAAVDELDGDGPHPVRLLGTAYTLAKLDDEWAVLPEACPHRLAPLRLGTIIGDRLQCAYHGWCFDRTGACVEIPALGPRATVPSKARLDVPHAVAERYGLVWVALDEPVTDIAEIPEWNDDAFGLARVPTQTWKASAAQMADNFLDVAHFRFTHLATIGDPDDVEVGDYNVIRRGWSFHAVHRHRSKVLKHATERLTEDFDTFDRTMTFRCDAPHHVRLYIDYGEDGDLVLVFFHQPVDVDHTRLYLLMLAENVADRRMRAEDHVAFQQMVGAEDQELLEQLRVKAVPLDMSRECHTRADKITVELRRMLADVAALA